MADPDFLLAQALWAAEQADFYDSAFNGCDQSDDSDFQTGRKRVRQPQKKPRGDNKQGPRRAKARTASGAAGAAAAAATATAVSVPAAHPSESCDKQAQQQQQSQQQQQQHGGDDAAASADGAGSSSGRRRRKDVGTKRERGRPWTAAEEDAFIAGLERHGRDWRALAADIGTRDSRAVASHAQKHFIRLAMAGQPLPSKVAASGPGYTLSGRPLDPSSAAAAAYGFNLQLLQGLSAEQQAVALGGILQEGLAAAGGDASGASTDQAATKCSRQCSTSVPADAQAADEASAKLAAALAVPPPALAPSEAGEAAGADGGGRAAASAAEAADQAAAGGSSAATPAVAASADGQADSGQTAYARSRPRREVAGGQRLMQLGSTSESLELLSCRDFVGPVAAGGPSAQPFSVAVHLQACLTMEVHVHLSCCEVIGLLGGSFDRQRRCLSVTAAFPCRRAVGSDAATSVELEPAAEVEARAAMAAAKLTPVGWYHSHPSFAPRPSLKDAENQRNYQALTRDQAAGAGGVGCEPFIGIILGPFDPAQPQPLTTTTAFLVRQQGGCGLTPYNLKWGMTGASMLPPGLRESTLQPLLAAHKHDIGRIDFGGLWRPFTVICPASGAPLGPPLSRLDKLLSALRWCCSHVADRAAVERWLAELVADLEVIWELPPLQSRQLTQQQQQQPEEQQAEQQQEEEEQGEEALLAEDARDTSHMQQGAG